MADTSSQVEIPNRALFKAAEVCDLVKVQPYVLRSWEAEFKDLGVVRNGSAARVYRRADVERVLRIKHLLLIEGLTLAGVRRRLEEEAEPPLEETPDPAVPVAVAMSADVRERIGSVRQGLRSLLDLLEAEAPAGQLDSGSAAPAADPGASEFALTPAEQTAAEPAPPRRSTARDDPSRGTTPRRKRSA